MDGTDISIFHSIASWKLQRGDANIVRRTLTFMSLILDSTHVMPSQHVKLLHSLQKDVKVYSSPTGPTQPTGPTARPPGLLAPSRTSVQPGQSVRFVALEDRFNYLKGDQLPPDVVLPGQGPCLVLDTWHLLFVRGRRGLLLLPVSAGHRVLL